MRWVPRYEAAWRSGDLDAVETLFSEQAQYRAAPYEKPKVGHAAIQDYWLDEESKTFTMKAAAVAVEGRRAACGSRSGTAIRRTRSTPTSGCCALPTTGGSRTSRSGPPGRASRHEANPEA